MRQQNSRRTSCAPSTRSENVSVYRENFSLLLQFAQHHLGKAPERLALSDLDAPFSWPSSII
jgi:hypothetical protein